MSGMGSKTFINKDETNTTSTALNALLLKAGWRQLPADAPVALAATAALYLAPNLNRADRTPWTHVDDAARAAGRLALVSKLRGHRAITIKVFLAQLLRGCDYHPETFIITPSALYDLSEAGLSRIQQDKRKGQAAADALERGLLAAAEAARPSCWIVKDAAGCGGDNIFLTPSAAAALAEVESGRHAVPVVVQRYLRAPLLLPGGRKFDVRLWVLVDADYRAYAHREGVCRTSSSAYDPAALGDTLAHITNHKIQATGAEFELFEAGNELFFESFDRILAEGSAGAVRLRERLWPQFARIVGAVFEAAREKLAPAHLLPGGGGDARAPAVGMRAYQLFGFDFLVDVAHRVHLLEVNASPGTAEALRPQIARDLLAIVGARLEAPPLAGAADAAARAAAAAGGFELVYSPGSVAEG